MESIIEQTSNDEVFDRIFHPANIAIIGVSPKGSGFGSGIMNALNAIGYAGGIFPVNPNGGRINGKELYRSLDEIPCPVDLAIIAVPAEYVPQTLEKCRTFGIAGDDG